MKINKIILCLILMAPLRAQASYFSWLFPKQIASCHLFSWMFAKNTPSLDILINQEIDTYKKQTGQIPSSKKLPKNFFEYRNKKAEKAFIEILTISAQELQKNPAYKNNPRKIVNEAKALANNAHEHAFIHAVQIWKKREEEISRALLTINKPQISETRKKIARKVYQKEEVAKAINYAMFTTEYYESLAKNKAQHKSPIYTIKVIDWRSELNR